MRSLGRQFGWLWVAFAVSTFGTWLAFDAFALIAIIVLHSGPAAVSALAAAGRVVGAAVAVPLAPWVEFRQKRPVMVAMDLVRPDRGQPNRPHTICMVGHQQHHHCCPDCSVGPARGPRWPAHGDRDCWYPLAGHPAPASSTLPPLATGDAIGSEPLMTAPLLASACRRRC